MDEDEEPKNFLEQQIVKLKKIDIVDVVDFVNF